MKSVLILFKKIADSDYAVLLLLIALVVSVGPFSPNFFTYQNLMNVLVRTTVTATAAIGMTFVIITGGIDLSIGGILVLVAYIGVDQFVTAMEMNAFIAALLMVLLGGFIGLINGLSVVLLGMPPFIATLAMLGMARGLSLFLFQAKTLYGLPDSYVALGQGEIIGIPMPIIIFACLLVICFFLLNNTVFGRSVFAVGNNKRAAWLAGIKVNWTICVVYIIGGITAGISSVILSSRLEAVVGNLGSRD